MTTHRIASVGFAVALATQLVGAPDAYGIPPAPEELVASVKFALQCHASFGTVDDVAITNQLLPANESIVVRGTYKQKIGGFNLYGLKSGDTLGGVFEGTYNLTTRRLDKLQFKISIRTGEVSQNCLR